MANFIKIGQTVVDIFRLTVFKMAAICHRELFLIQIFEQLIKFGEQLCFLH